MKIEKGFRRIGAALLFFIFNFSFSISLLSCSPASRFLQRSVRIEGRTYRYRVWLPPHYSKLRRWPVILFLHGSGERGDDNLRPLALGLPALLTHEPSRYRAIVVIPQCALNREWYGEMEQQALAALDASMREFHGDRRRVYLTGMSMGGAGVWYFARNPQRWAALIPVCGEVVRQADDPFPLEPPQDLANVLHTTDPYDALARRIGKIPVWMFHGADDPVIPANQSRRMFTALRLHHGNARYTEYPGVQHNSWDRAYAEKELAEWMMKQRR